MDDGDNQDAEEGPKPGNGDVCQGKPFRGMPPPAAQPLEIYGEKNPTFDFMMLRTVHYAPYLGSYYVVCDAAAVLKT